jgi:hypothetical protein
VRSKALLNNAANVDSANKQARPDVRSGTTRCIGTSSQRGLNTVQAQRCWGRTHIGRAVALLAERNPGLSRPGLSRDQR